MNINIFIHSLFTVFVTLFLTSCGVYEGESTSSNKTNDTSYKGLIFKSKNLHSSNYTFNQLTNDEFNSLNQSQKLQVANKLLTTLFFGYPLKELEEKIASKNFIFEIQQNMTEESIDKTWLENHILDEEKFSQNNYNEQVAVDILTRFYLMDKMDSYYLNNWVAYILTQTIMFSPSYELDTIHTPNIARVYNRLVSMLENENGMRYITYVHMMSEDNWRRFRSPEDNGREMLEIYALDKDDSNVPLAGQALKNWKLDRNSDTLVVSLNENTEGLSLFGTTIYNGDDFYRELAKSNEFSKAAVTRLVDFFFTNTTKAKKDSYVTSILSSNPETWQDILLQIVFSEAYLLDNSRVKSAEELFFSLAKKMNFKHRVGSMHTLKNALENMNQATMKYKLGKIERVPLDTLSFANFHKYIRENIMLRKSNPNKIDDYFAWDRRGWDQSFIDNENFLYDEENINDSLNSFINYLFTAIISRKASAEELKFFKEHIFEKEGDKQTLLDTFNMFKIDNDLETQKERREVRKARIAIIVLDYISRLSETYTLSEVN